MLRYIMFSVLMSLSFGTFAQQAEPVFITHMYLEWLDKEIIKYDTALENLQVAIAKDDNNAIRKNQGYVEKCLRNFDSNGMAIYNKISKALNPERINSQKNNILDGGIVEYNAVIEAQRGIKNAQEIRLTMEQADSFLENLSTTKNVYDKFSKGTYKSQEEKTAEDSIQELIQVQDLMNANNELLHKNYVKV